MNKQVWGCEGRPMATCHAVCCCLWDGVRLGACTHTVWFRGRVSAHVAAGCECGNEPRCSWRPFLLPGSELSHTGAAARTQSLQKLSLQALGRGREETYFRVMEGKHAPTQRN